MNDKTKDISNNTTNGLFGFSRISRQAQVIYLINVLIISLTVFFITFNLIYISEPEELRLKIIRLILVIHIALISIILLRRRKVRTSGILTCLGGPIILYYFPVFFKINPMEIYLSNSFVVLATCLFPALVLKVRENFQLILYITLLMLMMNLTSDNLMMYRFGEAENIFFEYYKEKILFLTIGKVALVGFLVANCLYILTLNSKEEHNILKTKDQLKGSNENLENLVRERTLSLEEKTKRLLEYTYINSHLLRGPVARLKGLMLLIEIDKSEANLQFCHSSINHCLGELDSVIEMINKILNEEDQSEIAAIQEKVRKMYSEISFIS